MKIEFAEKGHGCLYAAVDIDPASQKKQKIYFPAVKCRAEIELRRTSAGAHGFWTAEKMTPVMELPSAENSSCPAFSIVGAHDKNIFFAGLSVPGNVTMDVSENGILKMLFSIEPCDGGVIIIDTRAETLWNYAVADFFKLYPDTTFPFDCSPAFDAMKTLRRAALLHTASAGAMMELPVKFAPGESAGDIAKKILASMAGLPSIATDEKNISKDAAAVMAHLHSFRDAHAEYLENAEWDVVTECGALCAITAVADAHAVIDEGGKKVEISAISFIWLVNGKYLEEAYYATDGVVWVLNLSDGEVENADIAYTPEGITSGASIPPGGIGLILDREDDEEDGGENHDADGLQDSLDADFDDCGCGHHHNHR